MAAMNPDVTPGDLAWAAVTEADFEELAALRVAAMRESLEAVGRFHPERARERLRQSFFPAHTQVIVVAGERVGFFTFRPVEDGFYLDHLYVHPRHQSRGLGSRVLRALLIQADTAKLPVRLGALRHSASHRFYQRHGFVPEREVEWDIYYVRMPQPPGTNRPGREKAED